MIKCNSCQYISEYSGNKCAICGAELHISDADVENARRELATAAFKRDKERITVCRHLLADAGDTESQREYAHLLETAELSAENMDEAMRYYYMAAEKNDPRSAFHYAALAERTSEIAASFWLAYSAVLGYADGYVKVGDLMMKKGNARAAAYYYSEAAAREDTDATVTMARLYYEGIGVEISPERAKWYLDKLTVPPIHAIKLAYRLRGISAQEPPRLNFPDYDKYLRSLAVEAKNYGFTTAYSTLTRMLSERGDENASIALGALLCEGVGCAKDTAAGELLLQRCVANGSAAAALYLGEGYLSGKHLDKNLPLGLNYLSRAAKLGYTAAYERMGDIYRDGELTECDVPRAIDLYDTAAISGNPTAQAKASELRRARESYYKRGEAVLASGNTVSRAEAEETFRSLAISTAMGYIPAHRSLARCYAYGFGTERDRERAFFWYCRAVELGDKDAALPLALCYCRGFGTRLSYKKGTAILKLLAKNGSERAAAELMALYEKRTRKMVRSIYSQAMQLIYMKKYTVALELLKSSEHLGYPKALYTLGAMYEFGLGTRTDRHKAASYYALAARGSERFGSFTDPRTEYKSKILKIIR